MADRIVCFSGFIYESSVRISEHTRAKLLPQDWGQGAESEISISPKFELHQNFIDKQEYLHRETNSGALC